MKMARSLEFPIFFPDRRTAADLKKRKKKKQKVQRFRRESSPRIRDQAYRNFFIMEGK